MKRFAFAFLSLLGLLFVASAVAHSQQKGAPIGIEYYGQSMFILISSKGTRVAIDPHTIPEYDRRIVLPKVDVICITHNHNDHTRTVAFEDFEKTKTLRGLKTETKRPDWSKINEEFKDIKIRTVGTFHDNNEGIERGKNAVFIFELDGWKVAHLGDLGHILTPAQVKAIGAVDVLMIPVGGIYTLNGAEAKKVVEQLKPKEYIFPMHYGTKFFQDILPPDEFYDDVEKRRIAVSDDSSLLLNKDAQRPRPLIVQLNHEPKGEKRVEKGDKDKKDQKDKK
jgi:L-ascorbate metabolism protein UlaG (beta-lactamase superfamily)